MNPDEAFELEARVVAARAIERRTWVVLAEQLSIFHHSQAWTHLGWETFPEWIATPEVSLSRRNAYRLIQAWDWAGVQGVSPEALERLELTKLAVVIPAVNAGRVTAQDAMYDCELLSRSDLIEKYTDGLSVSHVSPQPTLELCAQCGRQRTMEEAPNGDSSDHGRVEQLPEQGGGAARAA